MRALLLLLVALPAWSQLVFTINGNGLSALSWNGTSYLGPQSQHLVYSISMDGTPYFEPSGTTSTDGSTFSQTIYTLGSDTVTVRFDYSTPDSSTLAVAMKVTNGAATRSAVFNLLPFTVTIPGTSTTYTSLPIKVSQNAEPLGFLQGAWGTVGWWLTEMSTTGLSFYSDYGSSGVTQFVTEVDNSYTIGPVETLQTFQTLVAPGTNITYHAFLRFSASTTISRTQFAPEAYTAYRSAVGNSVNHWPDRRCITQWFTADSQYRSATNPRGYLPGTSFNALDQATFNTWFQATAVTVRDIALSMGCQGVVIWDAEGQEFLQALTYVGAPNHLAEHSPEMLSGLPAAIAILRNAGLKVGFTLRPQYLIYGTSPPGTCTAGSSQPYNPFFINTTAYTYPSATRTKECTATNTWTDKGNSGNGYQTPYTGVGATSFNAIQTELQAKIDYAVANYFASFFYVDTTVFEGGTPYQYQLWKNLQAANPSVVFFPEESDTPHWSSSAPYRQCSSGACATPDATVETLPWAFSFLSLGNAVTSPNQARIQQGVLRGDIPSVGGWFENSEQTTLLSYIAEASLTTTAMLVTDSSTSRKKSFGGRPRSVYVYPLVMRVYFASSSGGIPASTTYCDQRAAIACFLSGTQQATAGSIDLSGMTHYQVRYLDYSGNSVSIGAVTALP